MGILDDILDHSKLEAGQLRIDAQVPTAVMADGLRLSQVLNNLLGNAVKFTEHGGVTLSVRRTQVPHRLRFEVGDTGPGIAADRRAALFSAFTQEDASITRRNGGSGRGLS